MMGPARLLYWIQLDCTHTIKVSCIIKLCFVYTGWYFCESLNKITLHVYKLCLLSVVTADTSFSSLLCMLVDFTAWVI